MVGMMYLVLTALLALNVSNTIIDKFVFINESLVRANEESAERNQQILESIVKIVDETGNREADLKVSEAAEELRAQTEKVLQQLDVLKDTFVTITGGYVEHEPDYIGDAKHLNGKTDYNKVGHYMMPEEEGGEGKGEELKELLNGYSEFVKVLLEEKFEADEVETSHYKPLAVDAADDPVYNRDANQKGKKFSQLAFEESPTPACLATVSEFQSRILSYETRALDYLSGKVGAGDISFDRIEAKVLPVSQVVAAGTPYEGDMFIAASATGMNPTMTYDGKTIPVENGIGKVRFMASASSYDDNNQSRKSFEAAITVPIPGGGDTTYRTTIPYIVTKPVIQIQSTAVGALYFGCGNELDVQVPALGTSYNPSFNISGGQAFKGSATGQVTIVPNARKVVMTVSSSGNTIGSREFGVKPIPVPEIVPLTGQGPVNMKEGISAKEPRLFLNAQAEAGFAEFLPKDAKFRVAQCEITLVSGGLAKTTIRGANQINLAPIAAVARKGNTLVIEIKKVQRQNFRGQVVDFPMPGSTFINIPLN